MKTIVVICVGITLVAACGGGSGGSTAASKSPASVSSSSSSSSSSAQSATSDDSCALLTDDEVKTAIGVPVTRREPNAKTATGFGCVKGTDRAADLTTTAFVSFNVFTTAGAAMLDQLAGESGTEQISGLGDRALFKPAEGFVFVARGGTVISVQVYKFGQPGTRDDVVGLARTVVGRV